MRTLMWFRADLRTTDNHALHHACRRAADTAHDGEATGVVAVYCICAKQWKDEHDWSSIKVDLILRTLERLSGDLAGLNIPLKVVTADTFRTLPRHLVKLARDHDCSALYFNREYAWNERQRDEAVVDAFDEAGIETNSFTDHTIWEPGTIRTGSDKYYSVFSPFKKACYARWKDGDRPEQPQRPEKQADTGIDADPIPEKVKGFERDSAWAELWSAGEKAAHGKLGAFVKDRMGDYDEARDNPAINGTSGVSAYLTLGIISPRQCLVAALDANNGRIDSGNKGAVGWIQEIIWREFYKHLVVGFPRVSKHRPFQQDTDTITWSDDDDAFEAWCEGRTGVPIVDAGMRQLKSIGWMHNRLRMITAMFLTKDLFIDWRRGERYFMQNLVDGDLASNNGGWQWSASTGTDAAPYFRIMNPFTQSKRFDPEGEYIREWVPELADLDRKAIHEPHAAKGKSGGLFQQIDYPEPIVDHKRAREHAIETFKKLKKG